MGVLFDPLQQARSSAIGSTRVPYAVAYTDEKKCRMVDLVRVQRMWREWKEQVEVKSCNNRSLGTHRAVPTMKRESSSLVSSVLDR